MIERDYANAQLKSAGETPPSNIRKGVESIHRTYGSSYKSNYVKAAYFLIEFFRTNTAFDLTQKLKQLFLDLLLTGEAYYRVKPNPAGVDPEFEVIKPENIFYNKNTNSQYIDTTDAIIHREIYTRQQVLEKFGYMLSDDDLKNLFSSWSEVKTQNYPRYSRNDVRVLDEIGDLRGSYFSQFSFNPYETVEVFHVEFISHNKVKGEEGKVSLDDFNIDAISGNKLDIPRENQADGGGGVKGKKWKWREDRYEGYRIGQNVYFGMGRTREVHRSQSNPFKAGFSYDGVVYNDRNGEPYSLGLALSTIQDKYDLLMYFRDNLIANSGAKGSRINMAGIPKALGKDFNERLAKFISYRKQGVELIDPTEEGAALFQHYGDFDNSIDGNGLRAIQETLESLEGQADMLTGVNRQMYGNIEERDAVSNVKVGIERSSLMVKDYFGLLKILRERMFSRLISSAQTLYKTGKRGSYVLGSKQITFEVVPKYFIHSDYGINISMDDEDIQKVDRLQSMAQEMASNGLIDPEILLRLTTYNNVVEMMDDLEDSIWKAKQESGEVQQLTGQLEQKEEELNEMQKELQAISGEVKTLNKKFFELEVRKVEVLEGKLQNDVKGESIDRYNKSEKDKKELDLKRRVVELEKMELELAALQDNSEGAMGYRLGNRKEVKNDIV